MVVLNKKNKLALILFGAPGSGKGTQGDLLLKKFPFFKRYVTSEIIEKNLKKDKELYDKVINKGELLNGLQVMTFFEKSFKGEKFVIIDGFTRTPNEAYWLRGFLEKLGYEYIFINIKVNEKKLIERITNRYYCPKCEKVYNLKFNPPKKKGICDYDGTKLLQRKDDTKKVFNERIKIFNSTKTKITSVFKDKLLEINGDKDINKVSDDIVKNIFEKLLK